MQLSLPFEPLVILHRLKQAGYEAYIVGGAVRDLLSHRYSSKTDFDFTTNATPEQIQAVFPESFYENQFGTVSLTKKDAWELCGLALEEQADEENNDTPSPDRVNLQEVTKLHPSLRGKHPSGKLPTYDIPNVPKNYEITTYRSEGRYTDHRRPDEVTWGETLHDDLSRRDFTMNAMAIEVKDAFLNNFFSQTITAGQADQHVQLETADYTLIDPFGGHTHLQSDTLQPVGDPATRFEEDALRMLRAIRFSVQLNARMTDETFTAISRLAEQIQYVSWERIRDEFLKMLGSAYPAEAIELLNDTGLLHYILPELREGIHIEQGGHHTTDVWTHSLDALASCPSLDPIVRFATLLHDVGKPRTLKYIDGKPTFYNHEHVGARMAREIAERFRLSRRDVNRIHTLVRHHMFQYQPQNTDAAVRRFMRKVGLENINDILDLREGDRLGSGARKTSWRLEEMKQRMIEQLHQPFDVTDLAVNGNELMSELQLKPGPILGKLLHALFEEVMENPELNTKEKLIERARVLYPTLS